MTLQHEYGWYDSGLENPGQSSWQEAKVSVRGERRIIDFISEMLQEGRGYQVRVGTIATGIAMQDVIADATAEFCYDALLGLTIIPIQLRVAAREIATATTVQVALKGVGSVSTAGTVFAALPLLQGGPGASGSARVAADAVTVTAELATTTVRIYEYENVFTQAPTTINGNLALIPPAGPADLQYVGKGPACIYFQAAATTAFPLYFAHLNVLELLSVSVG